MRLLIVFDSAIRLLRSAKIPEPEIEVSCLLGYLLQMNRAQLLLAADMEVPASVVASFEKYLARRLQQEPLAYILGEKEFWSLPFKVTSDVLIPRPETEFLIEKALQAVVQPSAGEISTVLDLGTGSGVIATVLALELPEAEVYGIDCSLAALRVAAANARFHLGNGRVHFIASDWLQGVASRQVFELVVTNPPYVDQRELLGSLGIEEGGMLAPDVALTEPHLALDGGQRGVGSINRLCRDLPGVLAPRGWLFMEIGADQKEYVMEMFQSHGLYESVKVYNDYSGLPRVLQARRKA